MPAKDHFTKRRRLSAAILTISLVAVSSVAFAADPLAARMVFFNSKPGSRTALEEGIKKQIVLRQGETNQWRTLTWEYVSGEVPRYCVATFGHPWADFDNPPPGAQAEAVIDSVSTTSSAPPVVQYFEHLVEISNFGTQTNTPALVEISTYQLHYGKMSQFYAALREFHEALSRGAEESRYEWFELRSGGVTPQFLLMLPRVNWDAIDTRADPLLDRLEEVLGKKRTARLFEQFNSAVKSHERTVARLRPDLSLLSARKPAGE